MYNGIINVYKEKGFTSHDVVAKLRGILKQKKIGHTGTLDPDAEGVLLVCLGKGTKLCDMLEDEDKTYEAVLLLGQETDTQDVSGKILNTSQVNVTEEEIIQAINSFIGEYSQIPPMYSAIKVNGKKLYELAREGKTVERKPRNITIYNIEIKDITLPRVTILVSCSKGTYIRTLCHDIGEKLNCHGCMEKLTRVKAHGFDISGSMKLSEIEKLKNTNGLEERIIAIDSVFAKYPAAVIEKKYNRLVYNGNKFEMRNIKEIIPCKADVTKDKIRVYDEEKNFLGIYEYIMTENKFKPVKMFLGE